MSCHRSGSANLERGDRLLALGESQQAIVEYQSAANIEPSAHAQRGLGLSQEELGAYTEADRHLEAALDAKPGDLEARVALARVQTHFGQYAKARDQLLLAIEQEPNHDPALLLLGVYAETRPQIQQAVDFLEARAERQQQSGQALGLEGQLVLADLMARLNRGDTADKLRENVRYLPLGSPRLALELARASLERDNAPLARALLSPLVQTFPDDSTAWHARAWQALAAAHLELGQAPEAREALQHLGARVRGPEVRLLEARLDLADGLETESTQKLERLVEELPAERRYLRSQVRGVLARSLIEQRRYDPAQAQLTAALQEEPQDIDASLTLARLHLRRSAPDQALAALAGLTDQHGRLARVHATIGEAQLQAGRLDQAEQAFRRLWELAPQEPEARQWLAVTLRRRGQVDQARRLLEGNLNRFGGHTPSLSELLQLIEQSEGAGAAKAFAVTYGDQHRTLAEVASVEGDWLLAHRDVERGLAAYRRALNVNAGYLPAVSALSHTYVRHGRTALAQSVIDAALAHDGKNLRLFLLAARVAGDLRHYDQAQQYCERALAVSPGHPLALAALAIVQAEGLRALPEAKQLAQRAFQAAPSQPEVLDAFGWVTNLNGDPAGALQYLEVAASTTPSSALFTYHWGAALLAAGRSPEANEKLAQVLKLDPDFPTAQEIRGVLARR
jgi:tetratricopeptide (TPR) repeat protein